MDPIEIGLIAAGLVLAFAGAALFKYSVAAVGFLGGAGLGYSVASYAALDLPVLVGAAVVCGLVGVFVCFSIITTVATVPGFAIGSFATAKLVGLSAGLDLQAAGLTFAGGVAGAVVAGLLFKQVLPIVTAFVGAALATRAWTVQAFSDAASSLDPAPVLFDPGPLFGTVFVAGALVQYGLLKFGYAKKIALPAGSAVRSLLSRGGTDEPAAAADGESDPEPSADPTAGGPSLSEGTDSAQDRPRATLAGASDSGSGSGAAGDDASTDRSNAPGGEGSR